MLTRTQAKELLKNLTGDYIPSGKNAVDIRGLKFRPAREDEVYRCGCQTGDDIQSGPIYCGAIADWIYETEDGILASCNRHTRKENRIPTPE